MGNSQPSYFSPQIFVPSPNTNLKGLINPLGENNCFLNVVIQSLWHLDSFSTPSLSLSLFFFCPATFWARAAGHASLVVLLPAAMRQWLFTSPSRRALDPQGQGSRELRRSISTRRPTACFARSR